MRFARACLVYALSATIALPSGFSASLLLSSTAWASAYSDGATKYQRGDFAGAERTLREALRGKLSARIKQAPTSSLVSVNLSKTIRLERRKASKPH